MFGFSSAINTNAAHLHFPWWKKGYHLLQEFGRLRLRVPHLFKIYSKPHRTGCEANNSGDAAWRVLYIMSCLSLTTLSCSWDITHSPVLEVYLWSFTLVRFAAYVALMCTLSPLSNRCPFTLILLGGWDVSTLGQWIHLSRHIHIDW